MPGLKKRENGEGSTFGCCLPHRPFSAQRWGISVPLVHGSHGRLITLYHVVRRNEIPLSDGTHSFIVSVPSPLAWDCRRLLDGTRGRHVCCGLRGRVNDTKREGTLGSIPLASNRPPCPALNRTPACARRGCRARSPWPKEPAPCRCVAEPPSGQHEQRRPPNGPGAVR